jgi:sulfide:quinone oxidoreductase
MVYSPQWLTSDIAVSGQISTKDISNIKEMGFKSIICNRPDFESDNNQPTQLSIKNEAVKLEITFKFLPVTSNNHSEAEAVQMADYLNNLPRPILAYCRSGGRSNALISLSIHLGMFSP